MYCGKVELDKQGDSVTVKLGVPGWRTGMPIMCYRVEFKAEEFKNIRQEGGKQWKTAKYPEWPPTKVGDKYVLDGLVFSFPWDEFKLKNPEYINIILVNPPGQHTVNYFDVYIDGKLVKKHAKSYTYIHKVHHTPHKYHDRLSTVIHPPKGDTLHVHLNKQHTIPSHTSHTPSHISLPHASIEIIIDGKKYPPNKPIRVEKNTKLSIIATIHPTSHNQSFLLKTHCYVNGKHYPPLDKANFIAVHSRKPVTLAVHYTVQNSMRIIYTLTYTQPPRFNDNVILSHFIDIHVIPVAVSHYIQHVHPHVIKKETESKKHGKIVFGLPPTSRLHTMLQNVFGKLETMPHVVYDKLSVQHTQTKLHEAHKTETPKHEDSSLLTPLIILFAILLIAYVVKR